MVIIRLDRFLGHLFNKKKRSCCTKKSRKPNGAQKPLGG